MDEKKESPTLRQKLGFRNWRLLTKLLVIMLTVSLIPLLAAVWVSTEASANAITQQTRISLSRLAFSTAQRIEQFLIDNHYVIRMAASEPEVAAFLNASTEEEQAALQDGVAGVVTNLLDSDPFIDLVGFYDTSGIVVYHNNPDIIGRDYSFRDYVQAALAGEEFTSGMQVGWTTDTPGLAASSPVESDSEVIGAIATRIKGVFVTDILISTLDIESEDITQEERATIDIFLTNKDGIIMSHSTESSEWLYRSLGVIEDQDILDEIESGRLLGGSCPEGTEQCDPSEKQVRLPQSIPTAQPLADVLSAAIQSGEVGSARYCHPQNVDDPPSGRGCQGTWHVVGYAPVQNPSTSENLYMVVVDMPEEIFLRAIKQQRTLGIGVAAVIAALATVASLIVARTMAKPIGKLAAAAQDVEHGKPFEPEEIADVMAQGDEVGNLARVFSNMVLALRARMAELRTVYQIGQDITATLEVEETLQAILDRVRDAIAYDAAEITLLDRQENKLIVTAWNGKEEFEDTRGKSYELGEGFTGTIGQERRGLLVPDIQAEKEKAPAATRLADGVSVRSLLGVPLLIRDHLVGTLELVSSQVGTFGEDDRRLLETIAPQAAIAIEKAQQVHEREQKLKSQIEQLRIEIDEAKRQRQVDAIVETDYFQALRQKARDMRERDKGET